MDDTMSTIGSSPWKPGPAFWILGAGVVTGVFYFLGPFVTAILAAAILAILAQPLYQRFRVHMNETLAALATVLSTMLFIIIPIGLLGFMATLQFNEALAELQSRSHEDKLSIRGVITDMEESLKPLGNQIGINLELGKWYDDNADTIRQRAGSFATKALQQTVITGALVIVAILTMFFMLKDGHLLRQPIVDLLPLERGRAEQLVHKVTETVHAVFLGVFVVALVQGTISGIAFAAFGVPNALVWGAATAFFCMIPFAGPPVVFVPVVAAMLYQGKITEAIVIGLIGALIVSQIDNLLRPKLIGDRIGHRYIATFFALISGILAFGPLGLMLGPIMLTIAMEFVDIVRQYKREQEGLPKLESKDALDPA